MANNASYKLTAWAKDPKQLQRLYDIMRYKDTEWFIYRVFGVYLWDDCNSDDAASVAEKVVDREGRTWYKATFSGDVAWGTTQWFDGEEDPADKLENGAIYTTLTALSKKLDMVFECYSEECGNAFAEHYCAADGEMVYSDSCEYHDWGCIDSEEQLEQFFETADSKPGEGLYTQEDVDEVWNMFRKDGYVDCMCIGGYEWEDNDIADILDGDIDDHRKLGVYYE